MPAGQQEYLLHVCGSMITSYFHKINELNEKITNLEERLRNMENIDAGIQEQVPCHTCQVLTMLRVGTQFFCSNDCVERFKNAQSEGEPSQAYGADDEKR